jgi:hypothetical protein
MVRAARAANASAPPPKLAMKRVLVLSISPAPSRSRGWGRWVQPYATFQVGGWAELTSCVAAKVPPRQKNTTQVGKNADRYTKISDDNAINITVIIEMSSHLYAPGPHTESATARARQTTVQRGGTRPINMPPTPAWSHEAQVEFVRKGVRLSRSLTSHPPLTLPRATRGRPARARPC